VLPIGQTVSFDIRKVDRMLKIPTVDDWFALTQKYKEYQRVSPSVLKDYGYMAVMDYIDSSPGQNILEFGHGFNSTVFVRYEKTRNVWGIDDWQGLSYFPQDRKIWDKQFEDWVRVKAPDCTYKQGLLGSDCKADMPENFFDIICSVSVLEEVSIKVVRDILKHAARLLKPGGVLIGTHDLLIDSPDRVEEYAQAHADAGLDLQEPSPQVNLSPYVLLENPTCAMLYYQHYQGEGRKFWGHWATIWTVAQKPSGALDTTKAKDFIPKLLRKLV
jgi:SAM-dependent methyltransferase